MANGMCDHTTVEVLSGKIFSTGIGNTPSAGPRECFNFNTQGNQFGNCGHTSTTYLACAST